MVQVLQQPGFNWEKHTISVREKFISDLWYFTAKMANSLNFNVSQMTHHVCLRVNNQI